MYRTWGEKLKIFFYPEIDLLMGGTAESGRQICLEKYLSEAKGE